MTRSVHTVPRPGGLSRAAMTAVLLAVLTALLHPPSYGSLAPHMPAGPAPASGAVQAGSGPRADDGHAAVRTTLVRSPRDLTGERPSTAAPTSYCKPSGPPSSTRVALPAASPPVRPLSVDRHQGRAPPPVPGT